MSVQEALVVTDIGCSQTRVGLVDLEGNQLGNPVYKPTDAENYGASMLQVAETTLAMAADLGHRRVVAGSLAVAGAVEQGMIVKAGGLSGWRGERPGADVAKMLEIDPSMMGTHNDAAAIAISQYAVNLRNGKQVDGYTSALGSGWGGSVFDAYGRVKGREPGHEELREGGICPCEELNHNEAFVSGNGILKNHGVSMEIWLQKPENVDLFVEDLATAVSAEIADVQETYDLELDEWRWTGGVALNQTLIVMDRVSAGVRRRLGPSAPKVFDLVSMADRAGLHGLIVDATRRARAA